MRSIAVGIIALLAGTHTASAQSAVMSLVPPAKAVAAEASVKVDLLAVNPSVADAAFNAPAVLHGVLFADGQSWPVALESAAEAPRLVPPGGFAYQGYSFSLPRGATGRIVLEIAEGELAPLRTVLIVDASTSHPSVGESAAPLSTLDAATPALAQVQRNFIGRFTPHEAVYFIYGPKTPGAKFQFSFKYRLFDFYGDPGSTAQRTLQLGYTQRSLWDIAGVSSPFYDTSYIPSLFFESLASQAESNRVGPISWVGYQAGYQHESNGRGLTDSRGLNTLFLRTAFIVGAPSDWHVIVVPKLWAYVGGLASNRDIADYRGQGELFMALGKNGAALAYTGRAGRGFKHFSTQLDLTIPVRIKLLDFASYFLVQYFNGYGESLRDYDKQSEALRAGISLVR